jgi:DeoR/GlpR family transcriptional regulator of sugar metabolism
VLAVQRRDGILRAVRSGAATVPELAAAFDVSAMTVRRDLRVLAREGKLERVHGGAVSAEGDRPFAEIAVERSDVKDRIGAAAARLVEDGQTVFLDAGTTALQVARHLRGRAVTVVTTNLAAYEELLPEPQITLILPGGLVRRDFRSLVGTIAEDSLRQLSGDVAFIGTSGVDAEVSVWDTTMVEVPIKRAMVAAADRVVLLADRQKFSMGGLVRVCGAADLDQIVTDTDLPAATKIAVEQAGIEVTVG